MNRVIVFLAAVTALGLLGTADSDAQPSHDKATAEQLFDQARVLIKQDKFAEACPKLETSYKLDPATGTLLNLALCYEQTGRLASAWGHYREAVDRDKQRGKTKRAAKAQALADALEPQIPRLTIVVAESNRLPNLTVERDGQTVDATLFGVAAYVDGGEYQIAAKAPGRIMFTKDVTIANGQEITVEIPKLETETKTDADPAALTKSPPKTHVERPDNTRRIAALGTGGAGIAILATGIGLGLSAKSSWNKPFDSGLCHRDTLVCQPEGQNMTEDAIGRAKVASVLLGVGALVTVSGVVLYLTAPKHKRNLRKGALTVVPLTSPESVGLAVTGGF